MHPLLLLAVGGAATGPRGGLHRPTPEGHVNNSIGNNGRAAWKDTLWREP
jgi:hypothetical protein